MKMLNQPIFSHEISNEDCTPQQESRRNHCLPSSPSPSHPMAQSRRKRRSKRTKDRKNSNASGEKAAAMTAAIYYGDCCIEGISADIANQAARESHSRYKKWWLQQTCEGGLMSSLGDAFAVPLFNPPPQTNQKETKDRTDCNNQEKIQPSKLGTRDKNGDQYCDEKYYAVDDSDLKLGGDAKTIASAIFQNGGVINYKDGKRQEVLSSNNEFRKEKNENRYEEKQMNTNPENQSFVRSPPQNNPKTGKNVSLRRCPRRMPYLDSAMQLC